MAGPTTPRRELLRMIALVVALDLGAILLYRFTRLRDAGGDAKVLFTVVWTLLTLAVVLTSLRRIRLARRPPTTGAGGARRPRP